ncbi:NADH-quinone oxidoreductase subunit L [Serratia rubidaea]|uniref:NADH-quinone oxidoreductase subunit L n=1 Tax=Serratia rubidaea TaxID=61652 RepID=A0A4U9HLX7_SERRU|nr:NADH-quinone oxidoreductase subunit L [Serratia rubidaea]
MYLGWEGVGLCSYLLIGFYYKDPANGAAAMKAFIVTRVGDVFLAFALFILYHELGTLNFRELIGAGAAETGDGRHRHYLGDPDAAGRRGSVNRRSCRCRPGWRTRWPARRRYRR